MLDKRILGNDDTVVTLKLSFLNVSMIIATVLYLFCFLIAKRKLASIHRINPSLCFKKLLILSILLVCVIRIMSFVGVTAMDIANVRAHYSPSPSTLAQGRTQRFYDASMTILFDLPNTIVVSTYLLLFFVWCECFLQSRLHTESAIKWKKRWLMGYAIFNLCLYSTQTILYVLIVWPGTKSSSTIVTSIIYAAMTGINFITVLLVCGLYSYLNLRFAGFPFRSRQTAKSLKKVSLVFALWSTSRILWAFAMLTVFIWDIELLQDSDSPIWTPIVLFLLLFVCEILPILAMLDYSYINIIDFEIGSHQNNGYANLMDEGEEEDGLVGENGDDIQWSTSLLDNEI